MNYCTVMNALTSHVNQTKLKLLFLNKPIFRLPLTENDILCATNLGTRLGKQSWPVCINISALLIYYVTDHSMHSLAGNAILYTASLHNQIVQKYFGKFGKA